MNIKKPKSKNRSLAEKHLHYVLNQILTLKMKRGYKIGISPRSSIMENFFVINIRGIFIKKGYPLDEKPLVFIFKMW